MGKKFIDDNGFLHLQDVPISRVQVAPYLGRQIDAKGKMKGRDGKRLLDPGKIYYVYRSADELFKPEVMKGFEGMPFRVGHQMLGNGAGNVKPVDRSPIDGTFLNVRRSEKDRDYLIADIIVYTDRAKNAIANGTRELSIGYRCAYVYDEGTHGGQDYQFRQTNIKANHLALVPHGRAGSSVSVQDEAIVGDDGLVVTCDSLPEEIQVMEEKEKKAKDKLAALLRGDEKNVQDCLDWCDLTDEQKSAIKKMKKDGKAEDASCPGCGTDEIPAPVPPPPQAEKEDGGEEGGAPASAPVAEPASAPAETAPAVPAPAPAPEAPPSTAPAHEVTPSQDAAPACRCCKTYTQDELDDACRKASKAARKDALLAKALAEEVGEDIAVDDTEASVARRACKKIKGLEPYAEDGCPDGEVVAAIRGHIARRNEEEQEKEKEKGEKDEKPVLKKKVVTIAQDSAVPPPPAPSRKSLDDFLTRR